MLKDGILSLEPSEVMTMSSYPDGEWRSKPVNFADFQGPPAATAYDQLVEGPLDAGNVWPSECQGTSRTICEDLFWPWIALPTMIIKLEPAWSACVSGSDHGNWVWDPPIQVYPTPSVAPVSVTVKNEGTHAVSGSAVSILLLPTPHPVADPDLESLGLSNDATPNQLGSPPDQNDNSDNFSDKPASTDQVRHTMEGRPSSTHDSSYLVSVDQEGRTLTSPNNALQTARDPGTHISGRRPAFGSFVEIGNELLPLQKVSDEQVGNKAYVLKHGRKKSTVTSRPLLRCLSLVLMALALVFAR